MVIDKAEQEEKDNADGKILQRALPLVVVDNPTASVADAAVGEATVDLAGKDNPSTNDEAMNLDSVPTTLDVVDSVGLHGVVDAVVGDVVLGNSVDNGAEISAEKHSTSLAPIDIVPAIDGGISAPPPAMSFDVEPSTTTDKDNSIALDPGPLPDLSIPALPTVDATFTNPLTSLERPPEIVPTVVGDDIVLPVPVSSATDEPMLLDAEPIPPLGESIVEPIVEPVVEPIVEPIVELIIEEIMEEEGEEEEGAIDVVSFEAEWYSYNTSSLPTSNIASQSFRKVKLIRFDQTQGNTWIEVRDDLPGVEGEGIWGDGAAVGQGVAKRRRWAV